MPDRVMYNEVSLQVKGDNSMNKKYINNLIKPFVKPSDKRAVFQVINTVFPYILSVGVMYYMIQFGIHYLFALVFSIIPALFLVRIFILFHDCTHGSFMKSKKVMNVLGTIFGILVFTPYKKWKEEHRQHHRTVGNIDKRGIGDVWTMTVDEYTNTSRFKKLGYMMYRNPLVLFVIGPVYIFLIGQRLPSKRMTKELWIDLMINNLGVLGVFLIVTFTVGIKYYILIQLPIIAIAASLGVWLFYIQHQYDEVYWEDTEHWDILDAALKGSSVYKLPAILNWFTGSIGYHNIHHLNAKIPNYRLKKLYYRFKEMRQSKKIKIFQSIRLARLFLYDENSKRLITHSSYRKLIV